MYQGTFEIVIITNYNRTQFHPIQADNVGSGIHYLVQGLFCLGLMVDLLLCWAMGQRIPSIFHLAKII